MRGDHLGYDADRDHTQHHTRNEAHDDWQRHAREEAATIPDYDPTAPREPMTGGLWGDLEASIQRKARSEQ